MPTPPRTLDQIIADAAEPPASLFGTDHSPTFDLAGPGAVSAQHPETSHTAAATDQGGVRGRVLEAIREAGPYGLCAFELVAEGVVSDTHIAGTRLQELRGGRARFPDRLVWRVVDSLTGRLIQRDGCAVHVSTDVDRLPDGWIWDADPAPPRLCKCCGQPVPRSTPDTAGT